MTYKDSFPWTTLADGLGSSLERLCVNASAANAGNWVASAALVMDDVRVELSGTPGRAGSWRQCPPFPESTLSSVGVQFAEIMYHAVNEPMMREQFEFIELVNTAPETVDLSDFRLVGKTLRYRFANGAASKLAPGARIVVSPNPSELKTAYGLATSAVVIGPYSGSLANGGDRLVLVDANGREVETVAYDDKFPWPMAADALGLSDDPVWTAHDSPFLNKIASFTRRGYSLQVLIFIFFVVV